MIYEAGWVETDREWESTLDLEAFDPAQWRDHIDRVVSSGISFSTVAKLSGTRDGWDRELHQLYTDLEQDVPSPYPILRVSFEDFVDFSLGRTALRDGYFIAFDGDTMVGLTEPKTVDDDATAIAQELTGVRSSHRGRGIATALKATAATWAKEAGYTRIRTGNAQSNAPMLAVNASLGFERGPALIEYSKDLDRSGR